MKMEENAPVTRGESSGSTDPGVCPSCPLDLFVLAPSLLLCGPSTIITSFWTLSRLLHLSGPRIPHLKMRELS